MNKDLAQLQLTEMSKDTKVPQPVAKLVDNDILEAEYALRGMQKPIGAPNTN